MEKEKSSSSKKTGQKILESRIYPLVFLVIIVLISVSLVMVIGNMTKDKIATERDAEIVKQLNVIFPDMQGYDFAEDYYEVFTDKETIGYAFMAVGKGYGGDINILVGIDSNYNIRAITVLSNTETPGLGTKIEESSFTGQFKGLGFEDVNLSKDGGAIDAITGATISSKAVTDAIRDELELKIDIIKNNN